MVTSNAIHANYKYVVSRCLVWLAIFLFCLLVWSANAWSANTWSANTWTVNQSSVNQGSINQSSLDVWAENAASSHDDSVSKLRVDGRMILQNLAIDNVQLNHQGMIFSLPTVSWVFQQNRSIQSLWNTLATKSHPFKFVDVINGAVLLQADLPRSSAVMTVQADGPKQFSGTLSLMQRENQPLNKPLSSARIDDPIDRWLEAHGQLLMDIQGSSSLHTSPAQSVQQWIYLIPLEYAQAQEQWQALLRTHEWQENNNFGLALNQWQKAEKKLNYYLDSIDGKTSLYLAYSVERKGDL